MNQPSPENNFLETHCQLLKLNFEQLFREPIPLDRKDKSLGQAMYESSYVVLSHNNATIPVFNYANLAAQQLWEMPWEGLTTMPSHQSAQENSRQDRADLLARVQQDGCSKSYSGIRASSSGRRFEIRNVYVWNLYDEGAYVGQAAMFDEWQYLAAETSSEHNQAKST